MARPHDPRSDLRVLLVDRVEATPSADDVTLLSEATVAAAVEVVWEHWKVVREHRYTQFHSAADAEVAVFVLRHRFHPGGWAVTAVELGSAPPTEAPAKTRRGKRLPHLDRPDPLGLWRRVTAFTLAGPLSESGLDVLVEEIGLRLEDEPNRDPYDRARFPVLEELRALAGLDEHDRRLDDAGRVEVAAMKMLLGLGGFGGIGSALFA